MLVRRCRWRCFGVPSSNQLLSYNPKSTNTDFFATRLSLQKLSDDEIKAAVSSNRGKKSWPVIDLTESYSRWAEEGTLIIRTVIHSLPVDIQPILGEGVWRVHYERQQEVRDRLAFFLFGSVGPAKVVRKPAFGSVLQESLEDPNLLLPQHPQASEMVESFEAVVRCFHAPSGRNTAAELGMSPVTLAAEAVAVRPSLLWAGRRGILAAADGVRGLLGYDLLQPGAHVIFDLETTNRSSYHRKLSPFYGDNHIVAVGWSVGGLVADGGTLVPDGTNALSPVQSAGPVAHDIATWEADAAVYRATHGASYARVFTSAEASRRDYRVPYVDDARCRVIVGHNIKFDLLYSWDRDELRAFFARGGAVWDTAYAHYLLTGQMESFPALDTVAPRAYYGGQRKMSGVKSAMSDGVSCEHIPTDAVILYLRGGVQVARDGGREEVFGDIGNTMRIYHAQVALAEERGMLPMMRARMDGLIATTEMEASGMHVDVERARATSDRLIAELREVIPQLRGELRASIHRSGLGWPDAAIEQFNFGSTTQLLALLFGQTCMKRLFGQVYASIDVRASKISWEESNTLPRLPGVVYRPIAKSKTTRRCIFTITKGIFNKHDADQLLRINPRDFFGIAGRMCIDEAALKYFSAFLKKESSDEYTDDDGVVVPSSTRPESFTNAYKDLLTWVKPLIRWRRITKELRTYYWGTPRVIREVAARAEGRSPVGEVLSADVDSDDVAECDGLSFGESVADARGELRPVSSEGECTNGSGGGGRLADGADAPLRALAMIATSHAPAVPVSATVATPDCAPSDATGLPATGPCHVGAEVAEWHYVPGALPRTVEDPAPTGMLYRVGHDDFIHHTLTHFQTVTGRMSSNNPNCQNLPRAGPSSAVRALFTSRFNSGDDAPGGVMIEADYSQLEIVCQGALSHDRNIIRDLKAGVDFHTKRLQLKLGGQLEGYGAVSYAELKKMVDDSSHPSNKFLKGARTAVKQFSFQRAYGAGVASLACSTGMRRSEVSSLIEAEEREYFDLAYFNDQLKRRAVRGLCRLSEEATTHHVQGVTEGVDNVCGPYPRIRTLAMRARGEYPMKWPVVLPVPAGDPLNPTYTRTAFWQSPTGTFYCWMPDFRVGDPKTAQWVSVRTPMGVTHKNSHEWFPNGPRVMPGTTFSPLPFHGLKAAYVGQGAGKVAFVEAGHSPAYRAAVIAMQRHGGVGVPLRLYQPRLQNYPVQGLGGEIMQTMLGRLYRALIRREHLRGKYYLVNSVHDCVWVDAQRDVAVEVGTIIGAELSDVRDEFNRRHVGNCAWTVNFPTVVECGSNMADLKVMSLAPSK